MDVAKYIGLFLLKNKACYIHGLGNLELKRRPATFNGEMLQAGSYEVLLTPSGSIDDNLANFIATNELISISKASNELRDYSTAAKADLAAHKDVVIPAIGKFTEVDGKLRFLTDPHMQYTPPAIPTLRSSRRVEEGMAIPVTPTPSTPRYREQQQISPKYNNLGPQPTPMGDRINWSRVALVAFIAMVVVVGVIYGIRFVKNRSLNNLKEQTMVPPPADTLAKAPVFDSAAAKVDSAAADSLGTITMVGGKLHFKVIIDNFPNRKKAEKKAKLMISYGHDAEVIAEDSINYDVVMPVIAAPSDTARIMDSMRRYYNPAGVYIY